MSFELAPIWVCVPARATGNFVVFWAHHVHVLATLQYSGLRSLAVTVGYSTVFMR